MIIKEMSDFSSLFTRAPFGLFLGALVFLVYWVNVFLVVYHLTRFGIGIRPKIISFIFFIGAVVLFAVVAGLAYDIDLAAMFSTLNAQTQKLIPTP